MREGISALHPGVLSPPAFSNRTSLENRLQNKGMMDRREFLIALSGSTALAAFDLKAAGASLGGHAMAPDLAHDPLRPQYHLLPPGNWMNDPNGPIWWKGKYHLFYQLNPHAAVWGDMHWGHAVSTDMVHWKHEAVALAPTPGGPDSKGCFSGSAVVLNGVPAFIYTGVQNAPPDQVTIHDGTDKLREVQLLATAGDDNLLHWKKLPEPVVATPPPGIKVTGFRDPCPWKEDDGWYLAVGSGERGRGGCVLLYRSQDLRHWDYLHPLTWGKPNGKQTANPCDSGEMWECPDFFPLGDRHCLFYSTESRAIWTTGHYDRKAHIYTPEQEGVLDHGAYYAPKSFLAPDGRRILWGWIQERRPEAEYSAAGWAGIMSLPRVLTIGRDGRLRMSVAEEVQQLRGPERRMQVGKGSDPNAAISLADFAGCCGELKVDARTDDPFELQFSTSDGISRLQIKYDPSDPKEITIDGQSLTLDSNERDELQLHAFVDGSVIELFLNNREALTKRFYYAGNTAQELHIAWQGDAAGLASCSPWELSPISADRLTR
jgi:beta-fructofuranosidase